MARRGGSGGAVVLVVFLVFFILLSMGLGVSTYMGFSQDDSKAKDNKKLTDEKKQLEADRDWYRFQALQYRAYMGQLSGPEFATLATLRENFDKGSLGGNQKEEEKTAVKTVVAALDNDGKLGLDAQKHPKTNYEELIAAQKTRAEKAEGLNKDLQAKDQAQLATINQLTNDKNNIENDYKAKFAEYRASSEKQLKDYLGQIETLKTEKAALGGELDKLRVAVAEERRLLDEDKKKKDQEYANLQRRLAVKEQAILDLRKELGREVPVEMKMDWRIVNIDSRGETAHINLGSADKVQPQLTFRVHGVGPDGRPLPKDKANVEVLNVVGAHLSQVKINYVTTPRENPRHDPRHDPVLKDDILINPSWNPNLKKHVAIAGVIDLNGNGRDDTEQFVRALEKQNVVVDAYLDLRKDFEIKGPGITVQTDFLILGDKPEAVLGSQGREEEIKKKISDKMEELRSQAKQNGVPVKGLRQYLDEIGFRMPGNAEVKKPVLELKGELPKKDPGLPPPVPDK
jgi:uncharacterized protein (UPF0335 family)